MDTINKAGRALRKKIIVRDTKLITVNRSLPKEASTVPSGKPRNTNPTEIEAHVGKIIELRKKIHATPSFGRAPASTDKDSL